jgi:hypothetical protein
MTRRHLAAFSAIVILAAVVTGAVLAAFEVGCEHRH